MEYKKNIAIVGPNKSVNYEVGKMLSEKLEMYFLDSDEFIEYEADIPPALLISDYGADFFYRLENEKIERLETFDNSVVSTSATALMNPANIENLARFCYIVLLYADREIVAARLKEDRSALLVSDVLKRKAELFANINGVALPLADAAVRTDDKTSVDICAEILEKLYDIFG